MLEDRTIINEAICQFFFQKGFTQDRNPKAYAGGQMVWRHDSVLDWSKRETWKSI
jgi:hypothetical protein